MNQYILIDEPILNVKLKKVGSTFIPGKAVSDEINLIWDKKISEAVLSGKQLWNGTIARWEGFDKSSTEVSISKINYSEGVCMQHVKSQFDIKNMRQIAYGTYISIFLKTTDDLYIYGQKSNKFAGHNGFSFIGGALDFDSNTLNDQLEIEMTQEIGLGESFVSKTTILTAVFTDSYYVAIMCYCDLNIDSKEVQKIFDNNNESDGEIESLIFVQPLQMEKFLIDNFPTRKHFLEQYKLLKATNKLK